MMRLRWVLDRVSVFEVMAVCASGCLALSALKGFLLTDALAKNN